MSVPYDEISSLRQKIETAATRLDLSPDEKLALLGSYRQDLTDLLGHVDTYMGDEELVRKGQEMKADMARLKARSNADLPEGGG